MAVCISNTVRILVAIACLGASNAKRVKGSNHEGVITTKPATEFAAMTSIQILRYKKTGCGGMWPERCQADGSTDGFVCGQNGGNKINDMVNYKQLYNNEDNGPSRPKDQADFQRQARCNKDQCASTAIEYKGIEIKPLSGIGAWLCVQYLQGGKTLNVPVDTDEGTEIVPVKLDVVSASEGKSDEDISVKVAIPGEYVKFEPLSQTNDGLSLQRPKAVETLVQEVIKKIGAAEIAREIKICGHGFTSAKPEALKEHKQVFVDLMHGRARKFAEMAKSYGHGMGDIGLETVAHPVHVEDPSGGLMFKLNGAASETCEQSDWIGYPLE
jgi:hypothetical protein